MLLLRRGVWLERATLGWNVVGVVVLAIAALRASSVALAGFGLDSLIEIGASAIVLWELSGVGAARHDPTTVSTSTLTSARGSDRGSRLFSMD